MLNYSSLQANQISQHLVSYRNDLGICLESTLGGNHLDKFRGDIHVGLFKGVGRDAAQTAGAGITHSLQHLHQSDQRANHTKGGAKVPTVVKISANTLNTSFKG